MKRLIKLPLYGVILLTGGIMVLFGSNLHTWHRLTDESPIAELTFRQTGPREYEASIAHGDFCSTQRFRLYGDQWRLDARFLKWRPWANVLGFDSMYRIERLGGRYLEIGAENTARHAAHALQSDLPDLTRVFEHYQGRLSPVDTLYGSSVYESMDERHVYRVYRGQSGLLVRKQPLAGPGGVPGGFTIPINTGCRDS